MRKLKLLSLVITMMVAGSVALGQNNDAGKTYLAQITVIGPGSTASATAAARKKKTKKSAKKNLKSGHVKLSPAAMAAARARYRQQQLQRQRFAQYQAQARGQAQARARAQALAAQQAQQRRYVARPPLSKLYASNQPVVAPNTIQPSMGQTVAGAPAYQGSLDSNPLANTAATPLVTTTVKKSESESKDGTWTFKYRSNNAIALNALEAPYEAQSGSMDHEIAAWDRLNITYHISNNISIDLLTQFYHTWFGDRDRLQNPSIPELQQPYAGYMGETGIGVVDSKLAQLVGGFTLDGYAGIFLPTAEWEGDAGTLGATRTSLGLGRSFGPFDIKWIESLWYYFQQYQTSSAFDTGVNWNPAINGPLTAGQYFRPPMPVQNVQYNVWSLLDMTWNFNKKLYFDFTSGFMNASSYADNNTATARPAVLNDNLILDPEVGYQFNKWFSFCIGLWEEADMRNQPEPYVPFNGAIPNNTQFYFMTTFTL